MQLLADDQPLGGSISILSDVNLINLCEKLKLDATHRLSVDLRDDSGATRAQSEPVTFELRKAVPKVTIKQPFDGGVDYARGGFDLIYEFQAGYDDSSLSFVLNGTPLNAPPTTIGTNSFPIAPSLLRDGTNELTVTIVSAGRQAQASTVRFSIGAAPQDSSKSKGGAIDMRILTLLFLIWVTSTLQVPGLRTTPMRVAVPRPRRR